MKANLVEKQEGFSTFWKEKCIYQKRLMQNEGRSEYRLLDGPPYANGAIHMGHALNKVLKDFMVRWKNISGYRCEFTPGWDVHGLPIENRVEREVENFKTLSPLEKINVANEFAISQVQLQKNQLSKLNLCFSFEQYYLTSNAEYIKNEYLLFQKLWESGLIARELKPVAWSYSSQTALAESELIYEEVECESIYFSWEVVESKNSSLNGAQLILWTTTPYSLEANLAVAFNPKLNYSLFTFKGKQYLASNEFISQAEIIFQCEKELIIQDRKITSEELESIKYFNNLTGEINPAFSASFLVEGVGSGFVHLAPGLGEEDYLICKENKINPYCVINEKGHFQEKTKFELISGKFYLDASKLIISYLEESKNLILVQKIKHKNAKDWRTGTPTFYRATQQWFLNLEKLREKLELSFENSDCKTHPDWLFSKLKETIFSRREWCLSRQRIWGLPIPVIFKNGEVYGGLDQLKKNISILIEKGIESWHSLHISDFLDSSVSAEKLNSFNKCKDVLDVWFDSGAAFMLHENSPSALYIEGSDQLRGWFNSSTILSAFEREKLPFKKLVAHGFVLDELGHKMSKSKGNVIDPLEIVSSVGSDIFRLWVANSNFLKDIKFSQSQLSSIEQKYRKFRNILFRFSLSVLNNVDWNSIKMSDLKPNQLENKFILWYFSKIMKETHWDLEELNFQKIMKAFSEFIELYSSWYLELAKPIIYSRENSDNYKKEIISTISVIFKYSLQILSIFIPQTAEEVYSYLNFPDKRESLWLEDYQIEKVEYTVEIDQDAWNYFFEVRECILARLEESYLTKEINSIKETKIVLPSEKIKYFDLETWARLLGTADVEETSENEIQISKSTKRKCPRCLLYWNNQELNLVKLDGEDYLLCSFCSTALWNYRNNAGSENISQKN